ncbi:site-specific integrase [Ktedonobacter racemifer]|uniref:site-specific integrase n=1 Tax=Ktedonobacter racemifer TaxID=363277 RepID=UPI00146B1DF0|nr:site-specific integrase [Ktedonobacter racemifer]
MCDVVTSPKAEKYDITPLTLFQSQAFLESLQGHRFEALFLLAIITGMRKGEILGLRWSDIDFEQQYVRVQRMVSYIERRDYLDPRYLSRLFARLLKKANLPHNRFHDLRHSAATIMLSMGAHFKVIQEILGHSSSRVALNIYAHVLPAIHEEAMSGWKNVFDEAQ